MTFSEDLERGRAGERLVESWLRARGWHTIPSYDFNGANGDKAPRLCGIRASYVIPDLDCSSSGRRRWLEVKSYATAPMNLRLGERVHGIKARHRADYLEAEQITGSPVFLAIFEEDSRQLLVARLRTLEAHPCMCGACRAGAPRFCRAPVVKRCVYFRRSAFRIVHTFDAQEAA